MISSWKKMFEGQKGPMRMYVYMLIRPWRVIFLKGFIKIYGKVNIK